MSKRDSRRYFDYVYTDYEMAVILNSDVDTLASMVRDDTLPHFIQRRMFYGRYLYRISRATSILIQGIKKKGVTRVLELLCDAFDNKFIKELHQDFNRFDLSSYQD